MPLNNSRRPWLLVAFVAAALLTLAACGGDDDAAKDAVFSPQNNQLDLYDIETGVKTVLIPEERNHVNGQVCLVPGGDGNFLLGEDTGQPEQRMGWGIFTPQGELVQKIEEPRSEGEAEQPEPFGCGFDGEDRLFVTDVGSGAFGAEDGKLIVFFPPAYEESCFLDLTLRTAGTVTIDDEGNVYVPETVPPGKVLRFAPPFPTSTSECESVPADKSTFIEDPDVGTPFGLARAPNGNWYLSSVVLPPAIREYDANGQFVRTIVEAETGGNPAGLAVAADGTIYYADLGLEEKPPPDFFGPAADAASVRRVTFLADGTPSMPETIGAGLNFADAVSILPLK